MPLERCPAQRGAQDPQALQTPRIVLVDGSYSAEGAVLVPAVLCFSSTDSEGSSLQPEEAAPARAAEHTSGRGVVPSPLSEQLAIAGFGATHGPRSRPSPQPCRLLPRPRGFPGHLSAVELSYNCFSSELTELSFLPSGWQQTWHGASVSEVGPVWHLGASVWPGLLLALGAPSGQAASGGADCDVDPAVSSREVAAGRQVAQ